MIISYRYLKNKRLISEAHNICRASLQSDVRHKWLSYRTTAKTTEKARLHCYAPKSRIKLSKVHFIGPCLILDYSFMKISCENHDKEGVFSGDHPFVFCACFLKNLSTNEHRIFQYGIVESEKRVGRAEILAENALGNGTRALFVCGGDLRAVACHARYYCAAWYKTAVRDGYKHGVGARKLFTSARRARLLYLV